MRRRKEFSLVIASAMLILPGSQQGASAAPPAEAPVWADYYGRMINLSESWRGAQACVVSEEGNRCFDTEVELDRALEADQLAPLGILATCSSTLRLYDGASYATPVLALNTRQTWINLANSGFADITSSYRVGACNSVLRNGSSTYPGNTSAGASAGSMLSGWNNTIDSVYIA